MNKKNGPFYLIYNIAIILYIQTFRIKSFYLDFICCKVFKMRIIWEKDISLNKLM